MHCIGFLMGVQGRPDLSSERFAGAEACLPQARDVLFYSLENSHNPFAFNGRVAAIFMVRL
jgi:hypothetical protein